MNAWERHVERQRELRERAREPVDFQALFGVTEEAEEEPIEDNYVPGEIW